MIQFDTVHKRFPNGTTAVHALILDMPEGGVTVLVGSSGCGKTTTLIPSQHIVPLVADRKADHTVRKALARLGNILTTEQPTQLNSQVDNDKKDPEDVSNAYAKQHGPA